MSGERGSATVQAAVLLVALTAVALVAVAVTAVVARQRRADAAADLAALAGASAVQRGRAGCAAAARIAAANHAEVRSCEAAGEVVRLEITARVPSLFGRSWELRSTARAGPLE